VGHQGAQRTAKERAPVHPWSREEDQFKEHLKDLSFVPQELKTEDLAVTMAKFREGGRNNVCMLDSILLSMPDTLSDDLYEEMLVFSDGSNHVDITFF
jgi:hypothetical protein